MSAPSHRYAAAYCEENVWWLAHERAALGLGRDDAVMIVSNERRTVLMGAQRASVRGEPVVWDYHVVLASPGEIWDLDCTEGMPLATARWVEASFPSHAPRALAPRFRVVPAAHFVATFASDRRHMRDARGAFVAAPPPWAPIGEGHDLERWIDAADLREGPWIDLADLGPRR